MKLSWRFIGRVLLGLALGSLVGLVLYVGGTSMWEARKPVQIIPWKPSVGSPYTCYVAIQGPKRVLAMDCLEVKVP